MVSTTFKYWQGLLVARYISSMSHNSGGLTDLKEKCFKIWKLFPNDDKGGVGGLNCTPCLVKPLVMVILSLSLDHVPPSMVNLNLNLGIPPKI